MCSVDIGQAVEWASAHQYYQTHQSHQLRQCYPFHPFPLKTETAESYRFSKNSWYGGLKPTPRLATKTENQKQKPQIPSFPRRRESRPVGAETYRIKRLLQPRVLDSHFRGNDGMQVSVRTRSDLRLRGNDGGRFFVFLTDVRNLKSRPWERRFYFNPI